MFLCLYSLLLHITCQCTSLHIGLLSSQVERSASSKTTIFFWCIWWVWIELIKRVYSQKWQAILWQQNVFAPDDSHSLSAGSEDFPEGILIDLHLPKIKQKHCCILEIKAKKRRADGIQTIWFLMFALRWNVGPVDANELHLYMLNRVGAHGWSCRYKHRKCWEPSQAEFFCVAVKLLF